MMKVGFIGLGRMGQGMAGRILAAGHDLLVSDPTPGQTTSLEEAGAVAVDSPAAATVDRDVVISMLPSDKILSLVLAGDSGLINSKPVHEWICGRCSRNGGRALNAATGQKARHRYDCAARGDGAQKFSAFDSHNSPLFDPF